MITSPTAVNAWVESSALPAGNFVAGPVGLGTPLAQSGWYRITIAQAASPGDTSATASIEIHTASTP